MRWTVVIPAKALPVAKSRLTGASSDPAAHRQLVEAIRADTVAVVRQTPNVARVLIVTDRAPDPRPPDVLVQVAPGLNAALSEAAALAARSWPDDGIAALVGDLPALRPRELAAALAEAAAQARAFVADADGTGTTLLTVQPGVLLAPAFGLGSAGRHASAAVAIDAAPGLRRDVDTPYDLRRAAELGVGPATAAVLAATAASATPIARSS